MEPKKRNIFVRFFSGLWRFLDETRRTVFNLITLFILIALLSALTERSPGVKDKTTLVIAPKGFIVDDYTIDPVQRTLNEAMGEETPETRLRDILRAIKLAATDQNIDRLMIVPDHIWSMNFSMVQEINSAIEEFKKSDKTVIAYGDNMDQNQYAIAALADKIILHPDGAVFLEGYSRYRNYYKEGLDKLGVDVHLFRVGKYKSAAEPYIRNSMSDASKEANLSWMGSLWDQYLDGVASARGLDRDKLAHMVNNLDQVVTESKGHLAQVAIDEGLVDELMTRDQMRKFMVDEGEYDEEIHSFRQVGISSYLEHHPQLPLPGDRVAVVVAQGAIGGGDQPPGKIGGESTSRLIRDARFDDDVKALVLRVNSPGGSVFPSELIRREIELFKESGRPVVVSMSGLAASGGYWISMNADQIWANPGTITGSIGIFGMMMNYPETLSKIGIHTDGVGTTDIAGAFRPDRPMNPKIATTIQSIIDKGYQDFIGKVAKARDMEVDQVDAIAQGRVWSGAQAKEIGLVDKLGGLDQAIEAAATLADISNYQIRYVTQELTPMQQFLQDVSGGAMAMLGVKQLSPLSLLPRTQAKQIKQDLELITQTNDDPYSRFAYCFCGL
ncbi:MAG: signal peptide peptidase SppA [bacterium]